ncbi:MAG: DUF4252 domain-containing protein [Acidobacteriota bacterium]
MTKRIVLFVVLVVVFIVASRLAEANPPPKPTGATAAPAALAAAKTPPPLPPPPPGVGVVDPEPFKALAGPDGPVTEVYLKGSLLRLISQGLTQQDPETGKLVGGLEAVTTIVIELKASQLEQARQLVSSTSKRLMTQGWEVLARVKDKDSNITVLTRSNDATGFFYGLQVFVLDSSGDSGDSNATYDMVFANIAGPMRLSDITRIGEALDIPAIETATDAIPGAEN